VGAESDRQRTTADRVADGTRDAQHDLGSEEHAIARALHPRAEPRLRGAPTNAALPREPEGEAPTHLGHEAEPAGSSQQRRADPTDQGERPDRRRAEQHRVAPHVHRADADVEGEEAAGLDERASADHEGIPGSDERPTRDGLEQRADGDVDREAGARRGHLCLRNRGREPEEEEMRNERGLGPAPDVEALAELLTERYPIKRNETLRITSTTDPIAGLVLTLEAGRDRFVLELHYLRGAGRRDPWVLLVDALDGLYGMFVESNRAYRELPQGSDIEFDGAFFRVEIDRLVPELIDRANRMLEQD
jgi:hypothetical protein